MGRGPGHLLQKRLARKPPLEMLNGKFSNPERTESELRNVLEKRPRKR